MQFVKLHVTPLTYSIRVVNVSVVGIAYHLDLTIFVVVQGLRAYLSLTNR